MTGACHYSSGCTRYAGKCGACHQILSADPLDVTHLEWIEKSIGYTALRDDQLVVVTPSVWLAQEARRSSLLGRFDVRVIPNGIDLTAFTPCDRQLAREALGLPREAFVIAFVADNVTTPRKGFQVLTAALERLPDRADTWLISVGNGSPTVPEGYRSAHFGRVQKDRIMSLFYSAADVFVAPTLEDNLPTTVLESLACGTPVIGSDVGGVPDMVRPGQTGFLFAAGSAGALAELLAPLRQREALAGLRPRCREVAEREYSVTLQAHRYEDLYRHLQPQ
jgi:glycosyltransferase involved in cell wall biosynthesis